MDDPRVRDRLLSLVRLGDREAARHLADDALRRDDLASARLAFDVLGHRRSAATLFELRDLAAREPSPGTWRAIVGRLRGWPESEGLLYGLALVGVRLERWPDRLRSANWRWWHDLTRSHGRHAQLWQLARRLELEGTRLHAGEVERVAQSPELAWMTSVSLEGGRCGDGGIDALADSPYLPGLRELELGFEAIGPRGARALVRAENLPRLERLVLANNPLGDSGIAALGAAPERRSALRELILTHTEAGDPGASALAASGLSLERLDLACNHLGDAGLAALFASSSRLALRHLDVSNNPLGDRGVASLAGARAAQQLELLDLGHTAIGSASLEALARSEHLAQLRLLRLRGLEPDAAALRRLFLALPALDAVIVGDGRRVARQDAMAPRGLGALADALAR